MKPFLQRESIKRKLDRSAAKTVIMANIALRVPPNVPGETFFSSSQPLYFLHKKQDDEPSQHISLFLLLFPGPSSHTPVAPLAPTKDPLAALVVQNAQQAHTRPPLVFNFLQAVLDAQLVNIRLVERSTVQVGTHLR